MYAGTNNPPNAGRTSTFVTDFDANDTREEDQEQVMDRVSPHVACRTVCDARDHANWLHAQITKRDLQTLWDIVKRHRLCYVCLKPGLHRGSGVNSKSSYIM